MLRAHVTPNSLRRREGSTPAATICMPPNLMKASAVDSLKRGPPFRKNKIFKINHHCNICRDIKYTLLIQNSRLDAYKLLKIYRIKTG